MKKQSIVTRYNNIKKGTEEGRELECMITLQT